MGIYLHRGAIRTSYHVIFYMDRRYCSKYQASVINLTNLVYVVEHHVYYNDPLQIKLLISTLNVDTMLANIYVGA